MMVKLEGLWNCQQNLFEHFSVRGRIKSEAGWMLNIFLYASSNFINWARDQQ